jgi:hypothetical protein
MLFVLATGPYLCLRHAIGKADGVGSTAPVTTARVTPFVGNMSMNGSVLERCVAGSAGQAASLHPVHHACQQPYQQPAQPRHAAMAQHTIDHYATVVCGPGALRPGHTGNEVRVPHTKRSAPRTLLQPTGHSQQPHRSLPALLAGSSRLQGCAALGPPGSCCPALPTATLFASPSNKFRILCSPLSAQRPHEPVQTMSHSCCRPAL